LLKYLFGRAAARVLGEARYITLYSKVKYRGHIVNSQKLPYSEDLMKAEARKRWIDAKPDKHLTWNKEVSGDAFIKKVLTYDQFQLNKNILEIGPGYGRLLKAILKENLPFRNYHGIDLSTENVSYLKKTFNESNVHFINGNAENFMLDIKFDTVLSSLTFKHIFPTFEKALYNISMHMGQNGMIFFDLIEGDGDVFYEDGTYIKFYDKSQVRDILRHSRLEIVKFDKVIHAPGFSRLLVIAKKLD
jgi:2-polyprenyl-3-methyl-5-hydroxy-6-metoxy-1,4-benzoquinol methylase